MQRNPLIPFTYSYSQPEEYHFSIDSIELAWEVSQYLKGPGSSLANGDSKKKRKEMRDWKVLDLCAGCGVVGLDLNFHLPEIQNIDFVEVQEIYIEHFSSNKLKIRSNGNFRFLNLNYESLLSSDYEKKYDLVICNPPYFNRGQGKLSPSMFKNRCRFFMDSTFEKLVEVLKHIVSEEGQGFLLLRPLDQHGVDSFQILQSLLGGDLKSELRTDIRGTHLVRVYR